MRPGITLKICALALVFAGGLAACGGGGDIDAFLKLDTEKAAAFAAGGDDCVAKAKSVGDWRKAHNAEYKALQQKLKEAYPEGPPADVMKEHGDQIQKNKKAVMTAMMTCANDETFGAMMDETKAE